MSDSLYYLELLDKVLHHVHHEFITLFFGSQGKFQHTTMLRGAALGASVAKNRIQHAWTNAGQEAAFQAWIRQDMRGHEIIQMPLIELNLHLLNEVQSPMNA